MNKKNITSLLITILLFNGVLLNAQSLEDKLYLSRIQNIISMHAVNSRFFLEFRVSCNDCIEGSNKESFFFICDTNNRWFFQRIGLYSASKIISMWKLNKLIDFYNNQDSILQYDCRNLVFETPLWHKGISYMVKVYNSDTLIFRQTIPQYSLDNLPTTIPICQYVNMLKQIVFDISVHFPYEYFPKKANEDIKKNKR
jgi:hypothetical protein